MFLSKHQDDKKRFSGDELVEINEIPKNLGKRILTRLVRGKIINSKKGIGGGFCLERDRKDITLFDVNEYSEIMDFNICVANNENLRLNLDLVQFILTIERIREVLFSEFKSVTFEDLTALKMGGCKKDL